MKKTLLIVGFLGLISCLFGFSEIHFFKAAEYQVITLAGSGESFQIDGSATKASFSSSINHLVADKTGHLYVNDGGSLRKVSPDGTVTTLFGQQIMDEQLNPKSIPNYLYGDGYGIALDSNGTIFMSRTNYTLVKVEQESKATIIAGLSDESGVTDGTVVQSRFKDPKGICLDKSGNLYIVDFGRIRKISANQETVSTLVGDKVTDFKIGATGRQTGLPRYNYAITSDSKGNLYLGVNDSRASCVAKITPKGQVSVLAGDVEQIGDNDGSGSKARFRTINAICCDPQDNIWVACDRTVRKITATGLVTTIAGNPAQPGRKDGDGKSALFRYLNGICSDATGAIYVTDMENFNIRKISKK